MAIINGRISVSASMAIEIQRNGGSLVMKIIENVNENMAASNGVISNENAMANNINVSANVAIFSSSVPSSGGLAPAYGVAVWLSLQLAMAASGCSSATGGFNGGGARPAYGFSQPS